MRKNGPFMKVEKPIKSIEKGLHILEYLVKQNHSLRLVEISQQLGFPLSTTHRLLSTLVYKGYACKTGDNRYKLTLKLFGLNNLLFLNFRIHSVFRRYLQLLCDQVKLSVHFAVQDEEKALLADVISSPLALKVDVPPGTREFLHSTAVGKILLSGMTKNQIKEIIHQTRLPKFTDRTITSEERLYSELQKIREVGFAVDNEEKTSGAKCVAVPIEDEDGKIVAALSVAGPISYMPEGRVAELIPVLKDVAAKIGNLTNKVNIS